MQTCYLSNDNVSFLSLGDVIVEVEGYCRHIDEAMQSVYSDLGEFRVDESMACELKANNGIHPSARGCGSGVRFQRGSEILASKQIPLSYIDLIIGEDGANVENIRKSSRALVYLKPYTLREVTICIVGGSTQEEDMNAIE
ncbi:unnamed protein product [Cuscuta campestris]|uniref:K Homology domain-containing protein n=1 Tax=Cuscuta campestris TaxID=132261 RepID=A0A484N4S2_9ASTE|nr:unnamed protein product [Cuscuta campestris]